jgi:phosphopantothenoylcysteine decarboxylase / phosphopantothenate---cysteine ligase
LNANLPCERLLVGISGSIQATQMTPFLMTFKRNFARDIRVILTENATEVVNPRTLELYTSERAFVSP